MKSKTSSMVTLLLICLLTLSSVTYAHSGRTDKYGCHKNSKTGDYHCHGSGSSSYSGSSSSSSSSSSDTPLVSATPTPVSQPPAQETITVESLLAQIAASYEAGNVDQALVLCDQLKIALEKGKAKVAVSQPADPSVTRPTSPLAFESSGNIKGTITIPGARAYLFKSSNGYVDNWYGKIAISIPGSLAIENRLFRAGETILTATFTSNAPEVISVNNVGGLVPKSHGHAIITVMIGDYKIAIPFEVVQLPFSEFVSQSSIVEALGFPDEVRGNYWYWNAYPDMCLYVPAYSSIKLYSSWDAQFEQHWK